MLKKALRVTLILILLVIIAYIPSSRATEQTNLVHNGSFEEPKINRSFEFTEVKYWRDGTFGALLEIWNASKMELTAPDGNQILELNSTAQHEIKQDIVVEQNTNYTVSYLHKRRISIWESTDIGIDGSDYEIASYHCYENTEEWHLCQIKFNSGKNYIITLIINPSTSGSKGNLIDDVRMTKDFVVEPTPTVQPTEEQTETPKPTPTESTSEPTPEPTSSGSPTQSPEPTILPTETVFPPSVDPSSTPPTAEPEPSFSKLPTTQTTLIAPIETPSPSESVINITPDFPPNDTTEEKVNQLIENLLPGEAITAEAFAESGLDYEDLPPQTPVELPNGVVLTAEIADAIQIFENPKEIIGVVFTDPKKALKALSNVGADLPPKKRKTAQRAVFPMIIVGQIAATTTMNLMQRRVGK